MKKLLAFLILVLLSAPMAHAGRTADDEDIYLMGWGGWRSTGSIQVGGGVGYVFVEGFGIGAVYEQAGSLPFAAAELRWFLEPFESALAFGVERGKIGDKVQLTPAFTLAGDYLFSLTPSMALRGSVKWLLPLKTASGVFTGLGFRILF